jgi:hypothetical protein
VNVQHLYPEIRARLSAKIDQLGELVEERSPEGLITWWRGRYWTRPENVEFHEMMVVAGHGNEEIRRMRGLLTAVDVADGMAAVLNGPDLEDEADLRSD